MVPYNPWLSKKYQSHINLEACMTVKSVKYLFKYVYKGHDCASIQMYQDSEHSQMHHDEISIHLDARYVHIVGCIAICYVLITFNFDI